MNQPQWDQEAEDRFRSCSLFSGLNSEQLGQMRERTRILKLEEGESLFHHGQPAKRFFLLHKGRMKLFRVSRDGMEKVIEILNPGRTFAEAVLFMEGKAFPVNAEALQASTVFAFDSPFFRELLLASPKACFNLLGSMSMRLHQHVEEIEKLTLQNATYRLVTFLLKHVPEDRLGRSQVDLAVPKRVIASRLSVQPETLSRLLQRLSKEGMISVDDQQIIIHDVGKLRDYIEMDTE